METFEITRFCFLRALAFIYCVGFAVVITQFRALCGERGILPVRLFLERVTFRQAPSIFWLNSSDRFTSAMGWLGFALAAFALSSGSDRFGFSVHIATWFLLWLLYLSYVNVGQTFYSFGWETLLLEAGLLAIFLGPADIPTPKVVIWMLRWLLFRVMFGAGMIKLRGDRCWWDLTCLHYHYQTQPMPNPLSWYFHRMPGWFHKGCVLYTHFVELIVPWGYFAGGNVAAGAGMLSALFQLTLIFSGNLSWLNWLTLVLCIPCFNDAFLGSPISFALPTVGATPILYLVVLLIVTVTVIVLSIEPAINLFSPRQRMNASFDSLHLVNTYGAFGSITKRRLEIIIQGTNSMHPDAMADWKDYTFKGKPGPVDQCPPIVAPYHMRLDWLMWFAAMGSHNYYPWFAFLIAKLLRGDHDVLRLMRHNPFLDAPPRYIRAELYEYTFTKPGEKGWWNREYVGTYLRPISLQDYNVRHYLRLRGGVPE